MFKDHAKPIKIEEALSKFQGAKFLSTIDLTSSYWQIPLEKESQKYTGFMINNKTYVFKVLVGYEQ